MAGSDRITEACVAEQADADNLVLRMAATYANIDMADARARRFLEAAQVPVDMFAVRILLREALLNAVMHGSGCDAGKEVRLRVWREPAGVALEVEDDGGGFVWQECNQEMNITGDGGRGLALMHMYASEVQFNALGNHVTLRRAYEGPARERTPAAAPPVESGALKEKAG